MHPRTAIWKIMLGPWMAAVIALVYLWTQPLGAFREPEAARIIFWHVPMAMLGLVWFWAGSYHAIRYLAGSDRGDPRRDRRVQVCAEVGLLCTILATVTGAVFAQVQWGIAWNWDPKQVSIVVLIVIYVGYFALRASVADPELRGRLTAAYAIFGAVATPFLMYVIPNLEPVRRLHPPGNVITEQLDSKWRLIYWMATVGFLGITAWMYQLKYRLMSVEARAERPRDEPDAGVTAAVRRPRDPAGPGEAQAMPEG